MVAVMLSIQPPWCILIADLIKIIEVRKTKPKIETPFKCFIYCTVPNGKYLHRCKGKEWYIDRLPYCDGDIYGGKVIGEFVCDAIFPMSVKYSDPNHHLANREYPYTCLTDKQIIDYLGNGVTGYGWHISDLKIYDKPKELSDFTTLRMKEGLNTSVKVLRPPQSWCYVKEGA